jgi:radical SAM superfamily enzyme YgiQ (UPF0313 family)
MKKVVFVAINCRWTHSNLAVFYLKKSIADLPVRSRILELNINQPVLEMIEKIYLERPDVLAFSVYIWNAVAVKTILAEWNKISPDCQVILGGPEVSYQPEKWLEQFPSVKHIICGAGEISIREVLQNNFSDVIIPARKTPFKDIPYPYSENDWEQLSQKYVYYESSRGCPFQCSFCLSSRTENQLDQKPVNVVLNELGNILFHQPKMIKFVDRTFNSQSERAHEIWKFLSQQKVSCHFEIHPLLLNETDFTFLSQVPANLFQFEIGIQTLNEQTLIEIHRNQNWQKCKEMILRLRLETKIHLHVDLILGLPYETSETFQNSFNEVYSLRADRFQLGFLKVLAGTEMQEKEQEYELCYLANPPYQILKTKWLAYEDMLFWQDIEKLVNQFYNSTYFTTTIFELEQFFSSPFIFYQKLRNFFIQQCFSFQHKDWQQAGEHLSAFIKENLHAQLVYFLDCLRWDWCKHTHAHFFPSFLTDEFSNSLKKEWYPLLKNDFLPYQLKSAIFLCLKTTAFIKKYSPCFPHVIWIVLDDEKQCFSLRNNELIHLKMAR